MTQEGKTYHISVKSSHELARSTRHQTGLFETVVEITSLEVVRNARDLGSSHIVHIGVCQRQLTDRGLEAGRLGIIQHNDPELVDRVILIGRSVDSVNDDLVLLTTASNENIHSRAVVSRKSQLGALSSFQRPHSPRIVHHRRNRSSQLQRDEHPSTGVSLASGILGQNNARNTQDEVKNINSRVAKGQKRDKHIHVSSPAFPDIDVVSISDACDRALLDPVFGVQRGRRLVDKRRKTLVALEALIILILPILSALIFIF